MTVTEAQIEHGILEWLNCHGYFAVKVPTSGYFDGHAWRKQSSPYAVNGFPDAIAISEQGQVLFIEVKTPKGKQSAAQRTFENKVKTYNGTYILARGIDDLKEQLDALESTKKGV